MKELETLRRELDRADEQLVEAFCRRMEISARIAACKQMHGLPVLDEERQRQKLAAMTDGVPQTLRPYVGGLYRQLAQHSRIYQQRLLCPGVRDDENVILIGMPGCGKTTVGRCLARLTGRPFADSDQMLEEQTGLSIMEIFAREGETGFRQREIVALEELSRRRGHIIATGGGCVTRAENDALLRSGRIVWLLRPLAELSRAGRPLSRGMDLAALYHQREHLYAALADCQVSNTDRSPEETAQELWQELFSEQTEK